MKTHLRVDMLVGYIQQIMTGIDLVISVFQKHSILVYLIKLELLQLLLAIANLKLLDLELMAVRLYVLIIMVLVSEQLQTSTS